MCWTSKECHRTYSQMEMESQEARPFSPSLEGHMLFCFLPLSEPSTHCFLRHMASTPPAGPGLHGFLVQEPRWRLTRALHSISRFAKQLSNLTLLRSSVKPHPVSLPGLALLSLPPFRPKLLTVFVRGLEQSRWTSCDT